MQFHLTFLLILKPYNENTQIIINFFFIKCLIVKRKYKYLATGVNKANVTSQYDMHDREGYFSNKK